MQLCRWKRSQRLQDMVTAGGGAVLLLACNNSQIHILRLADNREAVLQVCSRRERQQWKGFQSRKFVL